MLRKALGMSAITIALAFLPFIYLSCTIYSSTNRTLNDKNAPMNQGSNTSGAVTARETETLGKTISSGQKSKKQTDNRIGPLGRESNLDSGITNQVVQKSELENSNSMASQHIDYEITSCYQNEVDCPKLYLYGPPQPQGIPEAAQIMFDKLTSNTNWHGASAPFERSFGYCLRSRNHEYCYESASGNLLAFDWIRDSKGIVHLNNQRQVVNEDSLEDF